MDFTKVVNKRYSIRQFQSTPVPEEKVREIIELAKLAPSAGNLQSYKVVISKEKITNIKAPLNLIICADPERSAARYGQRGKNLYAIQDATIFASYLQLAIVDVGLASVWVGAFRENGVKNLLKIPDNLKPVAIISPGISCFRKNWKKQKKLR